MKKDHKELDAEQVKQALLLSSALGRAVCIVSSMSNKEALDNGVSERDRAQAISALIWAGKKIDDPKKKRFDVALGTLLFSLDVHRRAEVHMILDDICSTLCGFVGEPWDRIKEAFDAKNVRCPLALIKVHAAYQEIVRLPSGLPSLLPHTCCDVSEEAL